MPNVAARLVDIRARIERACARKGRDANAVTIIAVTKGHPAAVVGETVAAGIADVGENRVLDALAKAAEVTAAARWHLIGKLQRNKVNKAVRLFRTIHAVDSARLAEALGGTARPLDVFLQVNVSGETSKSGVPPEEALDLWRAALRFETLSVRGLMTMAPVTDDPEAARPVFAGLRDLAADLAARGDGPPPAALSMGMSGDFEVAVEEGATHVRIGTALVGEIPAPRR